MKRYIAVFLVIAMMFSLSACFEVKDKDGMIMELGLMDMTEDEIDSSLGGAGGDYLFKLTEGLVKKIGKKEADNFLISPLSIIYALSMTANGADGTTRGELLSALSEGEYTGEEENWDEIQKNLNSYLRAYLNDVAAENGEEPLHLANSIWLKNSDSLKVEEGFLNTNGKFYGAGIFKSDFDAKAVKEINKWIEDNTGGTIKDMIKDLNERCIMMLINALAFDAKWAEPFDEYFVREGTFFGEKEENPQVEFLYGDCYGYYEYQDLMGFSKAYEGGKYAFVGLLPRDPETPIEECLEKLDGKSLREMFTAPQDKKVLYCIPKFSEESAMSLVETFQEMGVETAFDGDRADFTKLGTYDGSNIYIGDILHNTYIEVTEQGTKAGAATVVMMAEGAMLEEEPPKEVYLNRPFIYMIMDMERNLPLFIGVIRNL